MAYEPSQSEIDQYGYVRAKIRANNNPRGRGSRRNPKGDIYPSRVTTAGRLKSLSPSSLSSGEIKELGRLLREPYAQVLSYFKIEPEYGFPSLQRVAKDTYIVSPVYSDGEVEQYGDEEEMVMGIRKRGNHYQVVPPSFMFSDPEPADFSDYISFASQGAMVYWLATEGLVPGYSLRPFVTPNF